MSEFEQRLKAAIARGTQRGQERQNQVSQAKASEEQLRHLHSKYRLELSEYVELVVRKLTDHIPGFRYETVFGEAGWGGACWRDGLVVTTSSRRTEYSRFELAIRPLNEYLVLDLQAKGMIANREVLTRRFYQPIAEADLTRFRQLIDEWSLSFAELYSSRQ